MTGATKSLPRVKTIVALVGAGGLLVAAAGAGHALIRKSDQASSDIRALRAQLARVKQDGDTRRARVLGRASVTHRSTAEMGALATAASVTSAGNPRDPALAPVDPLSQEESDYRFKVEHEARVQAYETAFARESQDTEWAASAQQRLERRYTEEQFRPLQLSVECRATLCRVGIRFSDASAAREAVSKLNVAAPWDGRAYVTMDTEKNEGVSFVAREGFGLPSFDPSTVKF